MRYLIVICICGLIALTAKAESKSDVDTQIASYFFRITGLIARPNDIAALHQVAIKDDGSLDESRLFSALFDLPNFIENRLATMISLMTTEDVEPFEDGDDFQAAMILAINSDIDLRDLLTKPFWIASRNEDGSTPTARNLNDPRNMYSLSAGLTAIANITTTYILQFTNLPQSAPALGMYNEGLMTTRGFAMRGIKAGTNRRAVRTAYNLFLCTPIDAWKDTSLDDFYVGRDVDRNPGGDPQTYQNVCRGCHAPMDSQRPAFAHYDYDALMDAITVSSGVVPKYNQNFQVFPTGYETLDDSWQNLLTGPDNQARFGWRGPTSGKGLLSFSNMIANSHQFQNCMTERVIKTFCDQNDLRDILSTVEFKALADGFRMDGYKMKTLIQKVVKSDLCQK